jgi:putative transcriptional regulator
MKRYLNTLENNARATLEGKFLIATPSLDDSIFERGLIYILGHDKKGALGVMINKPLVKINAKELADERSDSIPLTLKKEYVVFQGGPVEENNIMILTYSSVQKNDDPAGSQPLSLFTNADSFFEDILSGMVDVPFLIAKGYCSWAPGQLDTEIAENSWMVIDADLNFVFKGKPENKWNLALKRAGIKDIQDLKSLVSYTGNA